MFQHTWYLFVSSCFVSKPNMMKFKPLRIWNSLKILTKNPELRTCLVKMGQIYAQIKKKNRTLSPSKLQFMYQNWITSCATNPSTSFKNSKINCRVGFSSIHIYNKESLENEVADVHRNVPWAQQAEKKSLNPGF